MIKLFLMSVLGFNFQLRQFLLLLIIPYFLRWVVLVLALDLRLLNCCLAAAFVLLHIIEQHLNQHQIAIGELLIDGGLVLLSDAADDVGDCGPVLLHFLMVASALVGVARDDHIGHHLVHPHPLLSDGVGEDGLEEGEENRIF